MSDQLRDDQTRDFIQWYCRYSAPWGEPFNFQPKSEEEVQKRARFVERMVGWIEDGGEIDDIWEEQE